MRHPTLVPAYSDDAASRYLAQAQRFLRELQQHAALNLRTYRKELASRARHAAAAAPPSVPIGSFAMILRPRATKLLIPNSGPYLVTGSTKHTYLLRNIATGFVFHENKSNVVPMQPVSGHLGLRDAAPGIGEILGGPQSGVAGPPGVGHPQPKPATGAAPMRGAASPTPTPPAAAAREQGAAPLSKTEAG